jgi:hypothetical protein
VNVRHELLYAVFARQTLAFVRQMFFFGLLGAFRLAVAFFDRF